MAISQNLRFTGDVPPEDEFLPPGESVAKPVRAALTERGWEAFGLLTRRDEDP